jgi:hypothetical protein
VPKSGVSQKGAPLVETRRPMLLERLRAELRLRHYSMRTERAYVGWVRRFVEFNQRKNPRELDASHVAAFLDGLVKSGRRPFQTSYDIGLQALREVADIDAYIVITMYALDPADDDSMRSRESSTTIPRV